METTPEYSRSGNLAAVFRTLTGAAKKPPRFVKAAGPPGDLTMLWTITIILFVLWVVGLVSGYTLGAWIHVLLVLAVIMLIFNLLQGRRAL
jgi:Flp pilus assembly protein TadB